MWLSSAAGAEIKELDNLDRVYAGEHNSIEKSKSVAIKTLEVLKIKKNATRETIPRNKTGVIYKTLTTSFFPQTNKFSSGYGRVALYGKHKQENCEVDLFFDKASASVYLAMFIDKNKLITERYLDHPYMEYADILFQYLLLEGNRAKNINQIALVIDGSESGFKMIKNSRQVDMVFSEQEKIVHCTFDLALIDYFNGEQE